MADKKEKLFSDFSPVSTEQWMEKVTADLKGADFEKKLVWKTNEGFKVKPFYRMEDLEGLKTTDALPGEFPYLRGTKKDMLSSTMFESGCGVQAVRPAPSNKAAMGSFNFMVTVDNFNFIYVYYLLALFNVFAISKLLRYRDYCHAYSFSSRTAIGVMYWLPWYCFPFRLHSKLPFGSFTFPRRRLLVPFCSG